MSTAPIRAIGPGSMLGRYQVLSHLATGGMAEIYLARATGLEGFERYVVVKCIKPEHARDERFVRMFIDEARLSAQLHHQNIAQVYDIGQEGGAFYFAMEYVHGENVRELLHSVALRKARIPLEHALTIVAGAAAGLHYAHEARSSDRRPLDIVHRDVSPSNIIVTFDGAVKVVDFGIAKAAVRMTETRSGSLKGKIAYMSPEQCRGEVVDRRSDVFALGIVLYELTTVTRLFKGDNDYVTMHKIVTGDIRRPSTIHADYPPALEAIVMRALALDVLDRYPTVGAMLDELVGFCTEHRIAISPIGLQRYLRELFGEKPEPWLLPGQEAVVVEEILLPPPDALSPGTGSSDAVASTGTVAPAASGMTPGRVMPRAASQGGASNGSGGSLLLSAEVPAPPERRPQRAALWLSLAIFISGALIAGALVLDGRGTSERGAGAPIAEPTEASIDAGAPRIETAIVEPARPEPPRKARDRAKTGAKPDAKPDRATPAVDAGAGPRRDSTILKPPD
ncbi:MAG: protein kinase [Deltaproteobacteria bacterium]|nr:protein kinase [Kofleriaceae bacterium]